MFANVAEVVVSGAALPAALGDTHDAFGRPQLKRIIVDIDDAPHRLGSHIRRVCPFMPTHGCPMMMGTAVFGILRVG